VLGRGGLLARWILNTRTSDGPWEFIAAVVFGGLGFLQFRFIGSHLDRIKLKYALITFDFLLLSLAIAYSPFTSSIGLPVTFVFHIDVLIYFFVVIAVAAFRFSPGPVLRTGVFCAFVLLSAFAWAAAGLVKRFDWTDLPPKPKVEEFLEVFLHSYFVDTGSRILQALALVTVAGLLAVVTRHT